MTEEEFLTNIESLVKGIIDVTQDHQIYDDGFTVLQMINDYREQKDD